MAQFNPYPLMLNYTPMIKVMILIVFNNIPNNYLIFQQVTDNSVFSGKLSEKAKLAELKSYNSKAG